MKKMNKRLLGFLLAGITVFTFAFGYLTPKQETAAATGFTNQGTPVVVVTGDAIISDGTYTADNVSGEQSYTMGELKALDTTEGVYSTINTSETLSVYSGQGANIKTVLQNSGLSAEQLASTMVNIVASDGYTVSFDPTRTEPHFNPTSNKQAKIISGLGSTRYFYPHFNTLPPSTEEAVAVEPVIAWAIGGDKGNAGSQDAPKDYTVPSETPALPGGQLKVMVGQLTPDDVSNPAWNGESSSFDVVAGNALEETVLTIGSTKYTRADILMMDWAENTYNYTNNNGNQSDYVRGVPMSVLLDGFDADSVVTFETADNYGSSMEINKKEYTVQDLIDQDYMLAYEKGTSAADLAGIYDTAKKDPTVYGFLRLYGTDEVLGSKPSQMITQITVTSPSGEDFSNSPYKHITNGGQGGSSPYNIDSITGATLTVEGPGVKKSVPVSVRDLEGRDAGIKRADYTDKREGSNVTRTYEGIDLHFILNNMQSGDNGIQMTDNASIVQIKNRNRRTIAEFTVDQINEAHNSDNPIIVAYGTSLTNGENIRPFVFDNAAGADKDLGNEDGCIKLVYDKSKITDDSNPDYTKFGNMAYIYVAEAEAPGYKHDKAPYKSAENSNYVVAVTGEKIGREVNYTVDQLEDMVKYGDDGKPDNTGMGYRDEYSLANSTYWYVNEYEGVQLWKLLLKSGLDPALATDEETKVSSTATDGYPGTDKFTIKQVADPDSFGYYEKNPLDNNDGTYEPNENIRQGDDVSTGDKLRVGYPVLVAYGVNGYPYVEKSSQEGYLSGLQNDGGPVRLISGKANYKHANGSNQAKLLDKILVGEDTYHYSTHKYHDKDVYKNLADTELTVKVLNGPGDSAPSIKDEAYTVGDVEELIYGGSLTKTQLAEAKVKEAYGVTKNGQVYSDLYEGVSLNYFLTNVVELPGAKGTITFSNGTDTLSLSLEDVLKAKGSNEGTGMTDLVPVIAYGKNGAPMVASKNTEDGYEDQVKLAEGTEYENTVTIKNNGGPLQLTFPMISGNSEMSEKTITGINSITVNLAADKYAHTAEPYDAYKDNTVKFFGEGTRLGAEGKAFTVSELEGKQVLAYTGDYSILKDGADAADQTRYRGIDLYRFLTSTSVGLKANADKVIVTTTDGESREFTLSEIRNKYTNTITGEKDMPVILAYGSGKVGDTDLEDGKPLVTDKNSAGYDANYGNSGGPIRLVVGQSEEGDVNSGKNKKFVASIEVTAAEMSSWNHSVSEVFKQYLTETVNLQVVDKDGAELFNKDYTVEDIEAQTSLIEQQVTAKTTQENVWEGINLWKFVLQETEGISGVTKPITVHVSAADGFTKDLMTEAGLDALNNGIKDGENYVPILLAYGMDGMPLVIGDKSYPNGEGYDATVGNNGGPIRMVVHNNQGAALTYVKKIKITVGDGSVDPEPAADFTIKGLEGGDVKMTIDGIKNLKNKSGDNVGAAEGEYTVKGTDKKVKGALLKNILAAQGIEVETTDITLHTPDGFENTGKGASYKGISLKQAIEQNYFLAYQEWDAESSEWKDIDDVVKGTETHTNLRMYRNYCEANGLDNKTEWYDECTNINAITVNVPETVVFKENPTTGGVRSTAMDTDGNLWVGTYGGGLYEKKAGAESWGPVYNTSSDPALQTDFTSAVAVDADGGVWVSQNASYTDPTNNQGVLYIKDGEIKKQYKADDDPATIPNNYVQAIAVDDDGKVWLGSFGGVTIYDPEADTWTTYTKAANGLPATSCNTIVLDGNGGAWLGFYPDGSGTETDPYSGGFCHMTADGTVDKIQTDSGATPATFAQVWTRNVAIDQKGTVWVVASGTNIEDNVGGVIWKWKSDTEEPTRYTGKELFPSYLDGSPTTEVRTVAVAPDGSLWFGTSADGILKVDNPKLNEDGTMNVSAQYAKETGSWSGDNMNNIYSIDFYNDGTAYVGSSGGVQILGEEPAAPKENAGDATPETAQLIVDGDGALKNGYFTIKGLKNTEGLNRMTATYTWQNASGSTGQNTFEGAQLKNLFNDIIGLAEEARSFTVITSDGHEKKFDIDLIDTPDKDDNYPMIAWQSDEDPSNSKINPKLVVGQAVEGDVNKSSWISDVKEIRIDIASDVEKAIDAAIDELRNYVHSDDYTAENRDTVQDLINAAIEEIKAKTSVEDVAAAKAQAEAQIDAVEKKEVIGGETYDSADLRVVGDGVPQNGYFTYRSLKNADGLDRVTPTYTWKNSGGSTGVNQFEGAALENLFFDVLGISPHAGPVTFISDDGKTKTLEMSAITAADKDGQKPIIAWKSDENTPGTLSNIDFKVVFGQEDKEAVNKGSWIKNVVEIRVDMPDEIEHDLEKTEAVEATCTEAGNSEYYTCKTCGKHFSDAEGENEIEEDSWVIPALGHDLEKTEAVEPTCEEAGNSEYYTCKICGKHFSDAEGENEIEEDSWVIPAKGHDWSEVTYTWSDDNSKVTAKHVCQNDASHVETEDAETTSKVTKEATVTEEGEVVYTAEFKNPDFKKQTKTVTTEKLMYKVKKGDNQTWTKGSSKTLEVSFERTTDDESTYEHFDGVEIDGKIIDSKNYTAKSGSVVINLKSDYLETLSTGSHTLTPIFDDGKSESATFKVVSASDDSGKKSDSGSSGSGSSSSKTSSGSGSSNVKTGDTYHMAQWIALMFAALALAAGMLIRTLAERRERE